MSQSPENVRVYLVRSTVSVTLYASAGAGNVLVTPERTDAPLTNNGKSEIFLVPPPSFTTCFTTVIVAGCLEDTGTTAPVAHPEILVTPPVDKVPVSAIMRPTTVAPVKRDTLLFAISVPTNCVPGDPCIVASRSICQ